MNRFLILLLLFCGTVYSRVDCSAQFVTLQGKRFSLNGQDFYPKVMNYTLGIKKKGASYYVVPNNYGGPTQGDDCNGTDTCLQRIENELAEIRSMGFNAVRITLASVYRNLPNSNTNVFCFPYVLDGDDKVSYANYSAASNYTDSNSTVFFNLMKGVLNRVDSAGLKAILITAEDGSEVKDTSDVVIVKHMYPTYDEQAAHDYSGYLSAFGKSLQSHPALMAYDLFNEPVYSKMDMKYNNPAQKWAKTEICAISAEWYDTLTTADTNHLVTLGGVPFGDLEVWDPAVLKLDFYSPHIYPHIRSGESYDTLTINRYKSDLYWFAKTCPMPWMVGETGFATNDTDSLEGNWPDNWLSVDENTHRPPMMDGTEANQAAFARMSLDAVRNYGGSGYSWWILQDVAYSNLDSCCIAGYHDNWFGLLSFNNFGSELFNEKPAVEVFRNDSITLPDSGQFVQPDDYYDPLRVTVAGASISGRVVDQRGQPIEHARVYVHFRNNVTQVVEYANSTHTDAEGRFTVKYPRIFSVDIAVHNINIRYPGCDYQSWGGYAESPGNPPASGRTYVLQRAEYITASMLSNQTLSDPFPRVYKSSQPIMVDQVVALPGTYTEWVSAQSVTWGAGFEVQAGAEAIAQIGLVDNDCYLPQPGPHLKQPSGNTPMAASFISAGEDLGTGNNFVMRFAPVDNVIHILPNPFSGQFTVHLPEEPGVSTTYLLLDNLGHEMMSGNIVSKQQIISTNNLPTGVYQLVIMTEEEKTIHKLVHQN